MIRKESQERGEREPKKNFLKSKERTERESKKTCERIYLREHSSEES